MFFGTEHQGSAEHQRSAEPLLKIIDLNTACIERLLGIFSKAIMTQLSFFTTHLPT